MKIAIVKQNFKHGVRYNPYRVGLLSRLGIFCMFNRIGFSGGSTPEECLKHIKYELQPDPPKNSKVVEIVKI